MTAYGYEYVCFMNGLLNVVCLFGPVWQTLSLVCAALWGINLCPWLLVLAGDSGGQCHILTSATSHSRAFDMPNQPV